MATIYIRQVSNCNQRNGLIKGNNIFSFKKIIIVNVTQLRN